jgi:DNA-binding XRE family transcriptional regulator
MYIVKSEKLIQKREERNISQLQLSQLAGLSNNAVYRMEKQKHKVNNLRAIAISNALKCNIEELFEVGK